MALEDFLHMKHHILQAREGKQQTADLFKLIWFFPNIFLFTMLQNDVSLHLPREAQKDILNPMK